MFVTHYTDDEIRFIPANVYPQYLRDLEHKVAYQARGHCPLIIDRTTGNIIKNRYGYSGSFKLDTQL